MLKLQNALHFVGAFFCVQQIPFLKCLITFFVVVVVFCAQKLFVVVAFVNFSEAIFLVESSRCLLWCMCACVCVFVAMKIYSIQNFKLFPFR
jgi:hypothetical protein